MTRAFLDTGAIYSFINKNDPDHKAVVRAYSKVDFFLTHSAVMMETFSLIAKRIRKPVAIEVVAALAQSPKIELVHVDPALASQAWERCKKYSDKEWDWIDCVSFELMERRGIRNALALDRHFDQAGFRLLVP